MIEENFLAENESSGSALVRIRMSRPLDVIHHVFILLNSGRVCAFDVGTVTEIGLFDQLRKDLVLAGMAVFEIDFPDRQHSHENSSETSIFERTQRLQLLLKHPSFQFARDNFSLLGLSLGGQIALRYACNEPQYMPLHLFLIGTPVELPVTIAEGIEQVHLIYGANDGIGYLCEGQQQMAVLRPHQYVPSFAKNVAVSAMQTVQTHILKGCGHVLAQIGRECDDPNSFLSELLLKSLAKKSLSDRQEIEKIA